MPAVSVIQTAEITGADLKNLDFSVGGFRNFDIGVLVLDWEVFEVTLCEFNEDH
jgi:hypothetical protein